MAGKTLWCRVLDCFLEARLVIVIVAVHALECALLFGWNHFPTKTLSLANLSDRVSVQVQLALDCFADSLQFDLLCILRFLLRQLENGSRLILGWLLRIACLLPHWCRIRLLLANPCHAAHEQPFVKVICEQLVERFLQFGTVLAHALGYLLRGLGVGLSFCVEVKVAASEPIDDHVEDVARALESGRDLHELLQHRPGNVAQRRLHLGAQICIHGN